MKCDGCRQEARYSASMEWYEIWVRRCIPCINKNEMYRKWLVRNPAREIRGGRVTERVVVP